MPTSGRKIEVGDKIKFPMLENKNKCLFPISVGETPHTELQCVVVEGLVKEVDLDMIEIEYLCPKCNRYFTTHIMREQESA